MKSQIIQRPAESRGVFINPARLDRDVPEGAGPKVVSQFRPFPSSEKRVAFATNVFRLVKDDVFRKVKQLENQHRHFNGRFKFFGNDIVGAELMQFVDLVEIPRSNNRMNHRVEAFRQLDDPPGRERVGHGDHQDFRRLDVDLV